MELSSHRVEKYLVQFNTRMWKISEWCQEYSRHHQRILSACPHANPADVANLDQHLGMVNLQLTTLLRNCEILQEWLTNTGVIRDRILTSSVPHARVYTRRGGVVPYVDASNSDEYIL
jgi:hypothetical protein